MDLQLLEGRYFRITKRCASMSSFWPGQTMRTIVILRIIVVVSFFAGLIPQIARVVCFFSINVLLEQISLIGATVAVVVKMGNYFLKPDNYKKIIYGIRSDWAVQRSKEEMDIIIKYSERAYHLIKIYVVCAFTCLAIFLQMPITPRILDSIMPKNESRPLGWVFPAYYGVDEHKYHVHVNLHMYIGISMLTYTYIACDTSFMYSVQHGCGLLAVAGEEKFVGWYRYRASIEECVYEKNVDSPDEFYRRVRFCIQGHQRAIEYLKTVQEGHDTYVFICAAIVIICFSVILVKVSHMKICVELVKDYTFVLIQLMHMLYLIALGQFVVDSKDRTTESIYEALWYKSDKRTQLLFAFALRNCLWPTLLTAGGLITLNLQSFLSILKASVSYFTVLKTA